MIQSIYVAPPFRAASSVLRCAAFAVVAAALALPYSAQEPKPPSDAKSAPEKATEKPSEKNAAQIELLETKVRFESNGDSRKEVHARVRINNEAGARQFGKLNFDFNRSFQSVEIPFVRITHSSGGTADILPSAITDNPNPAVVDFPAYHDVRVKSVRILGLEPGDLLEYRVVTTTAHHPLAPDFWLDHTFDHAGIVSTEIFEINTPSACKCKLYSAPGFAHQTVTSEENREPRVAYRWELSEKAGAKAADIQGSSDVVLTTFDSWLQLSLQIGKLLTPVIDPESVAPEVQRRAALITQNDRDSEKKLRSIYYFVSQKITTVDLPLGTTGFRPRTAAETLATGYATAEDKLSLLRAFCAATGGLGAIGALSGAPEGTETRLATPSVFSHLLASAAYYQTSKIHAVWLDPAIEVAPFGVVSAEARKAKVLSINPPQSPAARDVYFSDWLAKPDSRPTTSTQSVVVSSNLSSEGAMKAKVRYALRGDNELLLRVAFHKTPKEKWKEVAQLLALSDGFRGDITKVTASDPYETEKPFEVQYEITQPKFADWSKKRQHVPALLPLPGLPDPPTAKAISEGQPIELGTPLAIDLESTIALPEGATAQAPIGTSVKRDYATFNSKYSVEGNVLHATRSLHFLLAELPASRAADFSAFLHAVQADQAQSFTVQSSAPN